MPKKINVYNPIPMLNNYNGHIHSYSLSIKNAVEKNGWNYKAFIPKKITINPPSSSWEKVLASIHPETDSYLFRNIKSFLNFFAYRKILQSIQKEKQSQAIIFFENFSPADLMAFTLASLFSKASFIFSIIHRYSPYTKKYFFFYYLSRVCSWIIERKKGKKILFFTDTQQLADIQFQFFKRKIITLPIPHTFSSEKREKESTEQIALWWPGGSIRKEKGIDFIIQFVKQLDMQHRFHLYLSSHAKSLIANPPKNLHFLSSDMDRTSYEYHMQKSDVILLPYVSKLYGSRSSGIFVEAIICGTLLITSDDTWMSHELKRYGLFELIVDWEKDDIFTKIESILNNSQIQEKLKFMQKEYQAFHSEKTYANILKKQIESIH